MNEIWQKITHLIEVLTEQNNITEYFLAIDDSLRAVTSSRQAEEINNELLALHKVG